MKMKNLVLSLAAALILSAFASNPAFAAWDRFEAIYMTDNATSTTPKLNQTFGWNETPYLYVKLRGGADNLATYWWTIGDWPNNIQVVQGHSDDEFYVNIANWHTPGIKKSGKWQVYTAGFYNDGSMYQESSAFFTVTPEPVSAALFLLGGVALAGRNYFFSKKSNKKFNK
jgi:hypothetical protein